MLWRSSSTPPRHPDGFIEPCLPTLGPAVPSGPQWVHEIKHDGFRFICRREGNRIRVFSRDMRREPWSDRRWRLARLLRGAGHGVQLSDHMEGNDGEAAFRHACAMGLEGIVAKRRDKPYRSGRSPDWIKVKNPDAPAATRLIE